MAMNVVKVDASASAKVPVFDRKNPNVDTEIKDYCNNREIRLVQMACILTALCKGKFILSRHASKLPGHCDKKYP